MLISRMKMDAEMKMEIKKAFHGVDRNALASDLGSSRNTIDQIANGLLVVSPLRAREIEKATGGKIKAAILRPDIFNKAA